MNLLICGGRDFNDYEKLSEAMRALPFTPSIIIEGGARGADGLARTWAIENGVPYAEVPALWGTYGKSAGHRRNAAMLLLNPGYCLALPGGRGTADMVRKCKAAGVPVWEPFGIHY
jgi:hypothetical protein